MTKIIGLTGGIGSGKSTVARYMRERGISVYEADLEAKKIMEEDEVIAEVVTLLGKKVLTSTGKLDRKAIADIVFKDQEKLKALNAIIHPKVKAHFKDWLESKKDEKFIVKEVAILFETKGNLDCDQVILVTAPLELRLKRTMLRDKAKKEEVLSRMNSQMPEELKVELSDYIIYNDNLKDTYEEVDKLLKKIENS